MQMISVNAYCGRIRGKCHSFRDGPLTVSLNGLRNFWIFEVLCCDTASCMERSGGAQTSNGCVETADFPELNSLERTLWPSRTWSKAFLEAGLFAICTGKSLDNAVRADVVFQVIDS